MLPAISLMCAVVFGCATYLIVLVRGREKAGAMLAGALAAALSIAAVNTAYRLWLNHRERAVAERKSAIDVIWQSDPALDAWSRYQPEAYRIWLSTVEFGAWPKKPIPLDRRDALIWAGRHNTSFEFAVKNELKTASDESVIAYANALVAAAAELEQLDARACADYLYPPGRRVDFSGKLSTATLNADSRATAAVIASGATHAGSLLPAYRADELLNPVWQDLHNEFGSELRVMRDPYARDADASELCRVTMSFYRRVLRLPEGDAGNALRYHLRPHA